MVRAHHQSQTPNSSELGVLFLQTLQTPAETCGFMPKPADHGVRWVLAYLSPILCVYPVSLKPLG